MCPCFINALAEVNAVDELVLHISMPLSVAVDAAAVWPYMIRVELKSRPFRDAAVDTVSLDVLQMLSNQVFPSPFPCTTYHGLHRDASGNVCPPFTFVHHNYFNWAQIVDLSTIFSNKSAV